MIKVKSRTVNQVCSFAENIRRVLEIPESTIRPDMKGVIKNLGGVIEYDKKLDSYATIEKSTNTSFLIKVNEDIKGKKVESFTIAHELGHLFLNMGYIVNEKDWDNIGIGETYNMSAGTYSYTEELANIFGLAFLMPQSTFRVVAEKNCKDDTYNIDDIAEKYNLGTEYIITRGQYLEMWD